MDLCSLPTDIVAYIISFLPLCCVPAISLINKKFYEIAASNELWRLYTYKFWDLVTIQSTSSYNHERELIFILSHHLILFFNAADNRKSPTTDWKKYFKQKEDFIVAQVSEWAVDRNLKR